MRGTMKARTLIVAALVATQTGCNGDSATDPSEPISVDPSARIARIEAVSAVELTGVVAALVTPPPTVRVTDRNGDPVAGANLAVEVTSNGGSIESSVVETDTDGKASVAWTLGRQAAMNTITVRVGTLPPILFTASAVAGPIAQIIRIAGQNQLGRPGSVLGSPLRARVVDSFDNPIAGAAVTFSVITGEGTIDGASAVSDSTGLVTSGHWTLGHATGVQQVRARSEGADVIFTADTYGCAAGTSELSCASSEWLVFGRRSDYQIYRIRLDGTGLTQLTSSGRNLNPAWSPDGRRIAFATNVAGPSNRGFGTTDVYTMDTDGSNVIRHTVGANFQFVAWSPDGRTLAVSDQGLYDSHVHLISAAEDGSSPLQLAAAARSPTWSPDGKKIAFVRVSGDDGYDQISVMNADGTGVQPLTDVDAGSIYNVTWSPDGQRIAFSKCLAGSCDLYTVGADGTGVGPITSVGSVGEAEWSPDGKWIAVTVGTFFGSSVAYVPADGGAPRIVVADGFHPSWRRH